MSEGGTTRPPKTGEARDPMAHKLFEPLRAALLDVEEPERLRLLASFLVDLAEFRQRGANGRPGAAAGDGEGLHKKVRELQEGKAHLEDACRRAQDELSHKTKELELAQGRAERLSSDAARLEKERDRWLKEKSDLEAELVAKNNEVHQAQRAAEELGVKLQRAELASSDRTNLDAAEEAKRRLTTEIAAQRGELDKLRGDRDADVERLQAEIAAVRAKASKGAEALLAALWDRLSRAQPPMADGRVAPTPQAAERLVDAFLELARFAAGVEQDLTPFLDKYTRHDDTIKRPWQAYRQLESIDKAIGRTIAVNESKPVGVLRARLANLKRWNVAATFASDIVVESVAAETEAHLWSDVGMGSDPNCKIKDYTRKSGPELLAQRMRALRSQKLKETFELGG